SVVTGPYPHCAFAHTGERIVGSLQRASIVRRAQRSGCVFVIPGGPFLLVDVCSGFYGRPRDFDDRQVSADAEPFPVLFERVGGDVVAHRDDTDVDALSTELLRGTTEMQDVPGVVAEAEDHAAAVLRVAGNGVDL